MKRPLLFFITVIIFLCVFFGIMATSCNNTKQADAVEKIPFSHKTHVEYYNIKDCGTCHKYDAAGTFQGLPTVGECTTCHKRNIGLVSIDHKTPRKKTRFDSNTDKDKPWISKAEKPELVYYSHKFEVNSKLTDSTTKLKCDLCHGDKASSDGTASIKGEKLMKQCIYCHTAFKMNNQCDVCHR